MTRFALSNPAATMPPGPLAAETNRRRFLQSLLATTAGTILLPPVVRSDDSRAVISIFHTTDLHGNILPTSSYEGEGDLGGLARCASQIAAWRAENPNSLLVDLGDVYQGTDVGLRTRGRVMIDLFNALGYDAWVVGNHEFDWGLEPFTQAVGQSAMPVLCANALINGRPPREASAQSGAGSLGQLRPWIIREIDGFRIGIIGVTTPGLPAWLHPELLGPLSAAEPLPAILQSVAECRADGADAIVLALHMGIRQQGDDYANQVVTIAKAVHGRVDLILAGHTHKEHATRDVESIPYTQAGYYGIQAGRVDLTFDRASKTVVAIDTSLKRMDSSVTLDPVVISRAAPALEESERALLLPVGELREPLGVDSAPGMPSDVERLIADSFFHAMSRKGLPLDAVLHGLFQDAKPVEAGRKTVGDIWKIVPYENFIVTAELLPGEILAIMSEIFEKDLKRNLMGLQVVTRSMASNGGKNKPQVTGLRDANGRELDPSRRYRIGMNSHDSQSGGRRLNVLYNTLQNPEAAVKLHFVQTREALIAFLREKGGGMEG